MIEQRQIFPSPDPESVSSALSAALSEATATTDSFEQPDSTLELPTSSTSIAGATIPATTNIGDEPTTAVATTSTLADPFAVATPSASTTDTLSPDATADTDPSSGDGGLSEDTKIGLGVGLGVGLSLLILLIALLCLKRRKRRREAQMGKYTPQAQSDLSMIEAPHAMAAAQSRHLPDNRYEPPKHYDEVHDYQMYEPSQYHNAFETPVSANAPSETQPTATRSLPQAPPVLTIPEPQRSPLHSATPSPARGDSPVSPLSISPVSPIGSQPPSPKHNQ